MEPDRIHYKKLSLPTGWCWCYGGENCRFKTGRPSAKQWEQGRKKCGISIYYEDCGQHHLHCCGLTSSSLSVLHPRSSNCVYTITTMLLFYHEHPPTHPHKPAQKKGRGVDATIHELCWLVRFGTIEDYRYARYYGNRPWTLSFAIKIGAIIRSSIYCELKIWIAIYYSIHTYRMGKKIKRDPIGSVIP